MRYISAAVVVFILIGAGYWGYQRFQAESESAVVSKERAAPAVEVGDIAIASIGLRRVFSGSLESPSYFQVSPKVDGRIKKITVDLGDSVEPGQVVALLEDDAYNLALQSAQADLQVAEARLFEAKNDLEIADRDLARSTALKKDGIESQANFDNAQARQLRAQAAVRSAEAQIARAKAEVAESEVNLGYLEVRASWQGEGAGVVADRFLNEGVNVDAGEPILAVVDLNPLRAVVYVTESDYGLLRLGQRARLRTDAYPDTPFEARVARVAPSFDMGSRQARVELEVPNAEGRLAPGMFARIEILLKEEDNATVVPLSALVKREDDQGIFVLQSDQTVKWVSVKTGIREGERVQIFDAPPQGQVVTLGQQMIADGSAVTVSRKDADGAKP